MHDKFIANLYKILILVEYRYALIGKKKLISIQFYEPKHNISSKTGRSPDRDTNAQHVQPYIASVAAWVMQLSISNLRVYRMNKRVKLVFVLPVELA